MYVCVCMMSWKFELPGVATVRFSTLSRLGALLFCVSSDLCDAVCFIRMRAELTVVLASLVVARQGNSLPQKARPGIRTLGEWSACSLASTFDPVARNVPGVDMVLIFATSLYVATE